MVCKKCSKYFPCITTIDGKQRNLCSRKYCLECSPFKAHYYTRKPTSNPLPETKVCRRCNLPKNKKEFYIRRNGSALYPYCIVCVNSNAMDRQKAFKLRAIEYKGGSCLICGYDSCAAAMDFHHINPEDKKFQISQFWSFTFEKITGELDKCVLLCCRCHREVEDGYVKLPDELTALSSSLALPEGLEPPSSGLEGQRPIIRPREQTRRKEPLRYQPSRLNSRTSSRDNRGC